MFRGRPWPVKAGLAVGYALLGAVVAVFAAQHAQTMGDDGNQPSAAALPSTAPTIPSPSLSSPGPSGRPPSALAPTRSPAAATATRPPTEASRRPPAAGVVVRSVGVNLAAHRRVTVSSHTEAFVGANVTDGDRNTYWEGAGGFPQTLRVDLGAVTMVGRLELLLPEAADWNRRGQRIVVSGSRDGRSFRTLAAGRTYVFDANSAARNAVSITVPRGGQRYLELRFLSNDGWSAAQLGEVRVHSG